MRYVSQGEAVNFSISVHMRVSVHRWNVEIVGLPKLDNLPWKKMEVIYLDLRYMVVNTVQQIKHRLDVLVVKEWAKAIGTLA